MLSNIAYCVTAAGLCAFLVGWFGHPLVLGYLIAGVILGPHLLDIVSSEEEISDFSQLGLLFLLFMIGLELDITELLIVGRETLVIGLIQFPISAALMTGIFYGLEATGMSFGEGRFVPVYFGTVCGVSSTMIVMNLLAEHCEMDSGPGRMTTGILIFQDIWAIVLLAAQPHLDDPKGLEILRTFVAIIVLMFIALLYAKFVMPGVFIMSSSSVELMLMVALAWCYFMCCLAILPFVNLTMEIGAFVSGVALATFPHSGNFNSKIKYIRDFFITLYFAGLGIRMPSPSLEIIGQALIVCIIVLFSRWVGIWLTAKMFFDIKRLASISTINLCQISELALVICGLGVAYEHVDGDSLTILTWAFAILSVISTYLIGNAYKLYGIGIRGSAMVFGKNKVGGDASDSHEEDGSHTDRNIVILGFHRVAAMLIAYFEYHNRHVLAKIHVIDFHESIMPEMRKRGVTCAYGDISNLEVLKDAHHEEVRLVIVTIPDSMLRGVTNLMLLEHSKKAWPNADVIVSADNPAQARQLYAHGADYVVRAAKLCAERIHTIITEHSQHIGHHTGHGKTVRHKKEEREAMFERHKANDSHLEKVADVSVVELA